MGRAKAKRSTINYRAEQLVRDIDAILYVGGVDKHERAEAVALKALRAERERATAVRPRARKAKP